MRACLACSSGAALLEFAFVLPILVVLAFGTFELGRALSTYLALEKAVRSGARFLARIPDPTCEPSCSPDARRAIRLVVDQVVGDTGLEAAAVKAAPLPAPPAGTVVMQANVVVSFELLSSIGLPSTFTIAASHQEQQIGE